MPQFREIDSYQYFMESAKRWPLLSAAQEIHLSHRIQKWLFVQQRLNELELKPNALEARTIKSGQRAYNRLFNCNLRLLGKLANKWQNAATHLTKEDLVQEGAIGLSRAILKFDATLGYKFSTYAYWWIQQSMSRAIDNSDRIVKLPGACLTALKKVRNWQPMFCAEHGRMPTMAECAAFAGVTVQNMKLYFKHYDVPVSLNVPGKSPSDGKEGGDTLQLVVCPGATPEDILNETAKGDALTAALKTLTQEQFMIIDMLYGLTGEKPLSIHMTCQKTKISKDKIRQIRDKALRGMRAYSCRHGIRL